MIFVTVGTHEQQFNRLIKEVDRLCGKGLITEDVVMQIGYSTYEPKYCNWNKLIPFQDMNKYIEEARIVITHGGPASFIAPLQVGKIPIVVPRQKQFGEHVNDHQLEFCKAVEERMGNIIVVEDISNLSDIIDNYESLCKDKTLDSSNHNKVFNEQLEEIVRELGL